MSERFDKKNAIHRTLFGNYQPGEFVDGRWMSEQARSSEASSTNTDQALAGRTGCLSFTTAKRLAMFPFVVAVAIPALFGLGVVGAIADRAMNKEDKDSQ